MRGFKFISAITIILTLCFSCSVGDDYEEPILLESHEYQGYIATADMELNITLLLTVTSVQKEYIYAWHHGEDIKKQVWGLYLEEANVIKFGPDWQGNENTQNESFIVSGEYNLSGDKNELSIKGWFNGSEYESILVLAKHEVNNPNLLNTI